MSPVGLYIEVMNNNDTPPGGKPTPSPVRTRDWLLYGRPSGYTQIRHVLVQAEGPDGSHPGPLAKLVRDRRHRELLLYLLLLASWPALERRYEKGTAPLGAKVWMRALEDPEAPTWTRSTMSRSWGRLEDPELNLVTSTRKGRRRKVLPRREDGLEEYSSPEGRDAVEHYYFLLPHEFWTDRTFARLTLPELAMFLILLKQTNKEEPFSFTFDRVQEWYGISRRTAINGINGLKRHRLVDVTHGWVDEPDSDEGVVPLLSYALTGPYSHSARRALRADAKRAHSRRQAAAEREEGAG